MKKHGRISKRFFRKAQPGISDNTWKVMNNLRTTADLNEFFRNRDAYQQAGVDIQYIMKYIQENLTKE